MKKIVFGIVFSLLIIFIIGLQRIPSRTEVIEIEQPVEITGPYVQINKVKIPVLLAQTSAEIQKGLSGMPSLEAEKGMLFLFTTPGIIPFWMPDMNFSIDIIWITAEGKIAGIEHSIPPLIIGEQPVFYRSEEPIQYVLEVNAGFSRKKNITVGDMIVLTIE